MQGFGRIKSDNQLFFLNTGMLFGVQSYSLKNNFGAYPIKNAGFGNNTFTQSVNSDQYADLDIQSYLIGYDYFISQTGLQPFNCFILNSNKNLLNPPPYSLVSGYLNSYSIQFTPNQIPQTSANIRFFNNAGYINTGYLDSNSYLQLLNIQSNSYVNFNNLITNTNYINLTLNESISNRITNFVFKLDYNRIPIYYVGSRTPQRVEFVPPVVVSCSFTFDADPSFSGSYLSSFPNNQNQQLIEVDVYTNITDYPVFSYQFFNMTMIDEKPSMNVDGNLSITRNYVGQLNSFSGYTNPNSWDFGFTANSPSYYIEWGNINGTLVSGSDFGAL